VCGQIRDLADQIFTCRQDSDRGDQICLDEFVILLIKCGPADKIIKTISPALTTQIRL
jgi:hypothetical protein